MKILGDISAVLFLFWLMGVIYDVLTNKKKNRAFFKEYPYISSCDPNSQYRPWFTKGDITWKYNAKKDQLS